MPECLCAVIGDVRADSAWGDEHYVDVEGAELHGEDIAEAVKSGFGGGVQSVEGRRSMDYCSQNVRKQTSNLRVSNDGADIDDTSALLLCHNWDHCFRKPHGGEGIHVKHILDMVHRVVNESSWKET